MIKVDSDDMENLAIGITKTPYSLVYSYLIDFLVPKIIREISYGISVLMEFFIFETSVLHNLLPFQFLKLIECIKKQASIVFTDTVKAIFIAKPFKI